jgi:hypothetical protein|tara:strand:- start:1955 stop:2116 length:162 start_codon:yes stop_codon:yes gene_type:complete
MTSLRHLTVEIEKLREEVKELKEKVNVTVYVLREPESDAESVESAPPAFPSVD